MPQLLIKRTATNNAPTNLAPGELAWSENGFLYIGRANGSVVPLMQAAALFRPASEALFAGALINLWNNSGTEAVRLANASLGYPAHGYVTQAITSGASAPVLTLSGGINRQVQVSGGSLTTGSYVLSTEPGKVIAITNAPASPALYQQVGTASGADFIFNSGMVIWR